MQDFRKLMIWQKSHELTLSVYRATLEFPREELYGLVSQMRRCASSVPSNIAEGCGRSTKPDFLRFLYVAMGSAKELEYQLLLCRDLHYLSESLYASLADDVAAVEKMLAAFIAKVERDNA
jgi:four helix bundle protein